MGSFRTTGQLLVRWSKPSSAMAAFRLTGDFWNSKQEAHLLEPPGSCTAQPGREWWAPMTPSMCLHSLSSHISFNLSRLNLLPA
uniref:Uncharacterized protein n=1 Tax=Arundo donax TaxID=35708 RepID=A0A0A9AES6_ARUDO